MKVQLVSYTVPSDELKSKGIETAEDIIVYNARVSNPSNQLNVESGERLIQYCIKHEHWSIFEQAFMTVEVKTSRAIAAQILRHRSFTFQEFSQRYAEVNAFEPIQLRHQAISNRQSSTEVIEDESCKKIAHAAINAANIAYNELLAKGVAREVARMVLPLSTQTTLYMSGSCRSFIHYINLRTRDETQLEHRVIAQGVQYQFKRVFPMVSHALGY